MVNFPLVLGLAEKEYITIALIVVLSFVLVRIIHVFLKRSLQKSYENFNEVRTNFAFINNSSRFVIFTIAIILIIYTIPPLKSIGLSLFAGAGIFAAILGLASQQAFSNIISGIFIVISKPFRVGDIVMIGDGLVAKGTVEDITLRHTVINNFENRKVIIPNSVISSQIIVNSSISDLKTCMHVHFGISYSSNIDKAIEIVQQLARKHKDFIDNRTEEDHAENHPDVVVRVLNLGEYAIEMRAYVWAPTSNKGFALKCDLLKQIKEAFDKEGIEIPFPYRNLIFKNDINSNGQA
jgi:small conductance mechanosensitive channel